MTTAAPSKLNVLCTVCKLPVEIDADVAAFAQILSKHAVRKHMEPLHDDEVAIHPKCREIWNETKNVRAATRPLSPSGSTWTRDAVASLGHDNRSRAAAEHSENEREPGSDDD